MKILSKQFNADWKHLFNYKWINTKKVSHNINRTEVLISKSKQKKIEGDLRKTYMWQKTTFYWKS